MAPLVRYSSAMDVVEIQKLAELEDTHWWYAERRHVLDRLVSRLPPGQALDVGAAAGGNTRVLRARGWESVALEYSQDGAALAKGRGIDTVRGDAVHLPVGSSTFDLVIAFDVIEHIEDDVGAVAEFRRALRPGGKALIAVPAGMDLWSAHDVAVGHVRRYEIDQLRSVVEAAGLAVDFVKSWNVLLRPVAKRHRRNAQGSDHVRLNPAVNAGLRTVVAMERYLPVGRFRGVSLMLAATDPARA